MSKNQIRIAFITVFTALILGCTSGDERKAEYLARAQAHFDAGTYDKAKVDVRNAIQIDNSYVEARYLYARLLELDEAWQPMVTNLRLVIELDPAHVEARVRYGTVLMAGRLFDEALEQANAAIDVAPDSAKAYALIGAINYQQGNNDLAIAAAQTALSHDPKSVDAIAVLTSVYKTRNPTLALEVIEEGIALQEDRSILKLLEISVYEETGDIDSAVAIYQELVDQYPENLYYFYRYATLLESNERHAEAEALIRQISAAKPEEIELKLWLAQYLVNHRDLGAAEEALRTFVEQSPNETQLSLALGQVLAGQSKIEEARLLYSSQAEADTESDAAQQARFALMQLEARLGNESKAEEILATILEIEPENPDALVISTRQALAEGDLENAIAQARTVLRNVPDSVAALELLARAHEQNDAVDLAKDNLRQILTIDSQHAYALNRLTEFALDDQDTDLAIDLASSALRADSTNAEAAKLLVIAYSQKGETDKALTQADSLAQIEQSKALGKFMLARVYQFDQQYEQAIENYSEVLEMEPRVVEALQGLIESMVAMDQAEQAEAYLDHYIATNENHAHALNLKAALKLQEGNTEGASIQYRQAIAEFPASLDAHINLGDLLYREGRIEAALASYERARAVDPADTAVLTRMGQISETLGREAEAIQYYESALTHNRDLVIARNNLAVLYSTAESTPEELERALALMRPFATSTEPALLDTLGWIYYRLGDGEQALRYIKTAVDSGADDPAIQYHLGAAYVLTNREAEAKAALEKALSSGIQFEGYDDAETHLANL